MKPGEVRLVATAVTIAEQIRNSTRPETLNHVAARNAGLWTSEGFYTNRGSAWRDLMNRAKEVADAFDRFAMNVANGLE